MNARPIGEQKSIEVAAAQVAVAQLGLDEECDLERRRRTLVGHPGDADDDPAAVEPVEGRAQPGGSLGGVEVVGLGLEVLDRLGHDARAGRQHQMVVAERQAVGQGDDPPDLVDAVDLADDERDSLVEQAALRTLQLGGALAAHRDVHEARLVDVLAGRVDDDDLDLAVIDPVAQLPDQQVGGERPPDAAAEDEDALHGRGYRTLLDDDLVVAVAGLESDQPMAGLLDPLGDVGPGALVRGIDGDHVADLALADGPDELHQRSRAEAAAGVDGAGDGDGRCRSWRSIPSDCALR